MDVNVSELRQDLAAWLDRVRGGVEVTVTVRGAAVARLVPIEDPRGAARRKLEGLRAQARVGDVESPIDEPWDALHDRG